MPEIRHEYHAELDSIRDDIARLGAMVTETIPQGTEALLSSDLGEAKAVIEGDDPIDALTLQIEERCYRLLALQQPMASDLRAIVTAIRLTSEIERSADLMVNVAKASRRLYRTGIDPRLRGLIAKMAAEAAKLFQIALDAYVDGDADKASALDDMDDALDTLHKQFIKAIFESHETKNLDLESGVQLALVGRYYERIGDHAVNIGERVQYMVTGWLPEHTGAARDAARHSAEAKAGADVASATPADPETYVTVLVTNDDGIDGPGLHALAAALVGAGHEVVVAAPEVNMSGAGASVGHLALDSRIGLRRTSLPGLDVPAFAVDGPPGLIVLLARLGGLGDGITAVASGINPGWNTGRSVLHSGTVGAVLTGAAGGWSGVAVSSGDQPTHWATAADLAVEALDWVLGEPAGTALNLNVPDLPRAQLEGVAWGHLANPPAVKTSLVGAGEGYVKLSLEVEDLATAYAEGADDDSDTGLVQRGWAAVTLLRSVSEAPERPVADHLRNRLAAIGER